VSAPSDDHRGRPGRSLDQRGDRFGPVGPVVDHHPADLLQQIGLCVRAAAGVQQRHIAPADPRLRQGEVDHPGRHRGFIDPDHDRPVYPVRAGRPAWHSDDQHRSTMVTGHPVTDRHAERRTGRAVPSAHDHQIRARRVGEQDGRRIAHLQPTDHRHRVGVGVDPVRHLLEQAGTAIPCGSTSRPAGFDVQDSQIPSVHAGFDRRVVQGQIAGRRVIHTDHHQPRRARRRSNGRLWFGVCHLEPALPVGHDAKVSSDRIAVPARQGCLGCGTEGFPFPSLSLEIVHRPPPASSWRTPSSTLRRRSSCQSHWSYFAAPARFLGHRRGDRHRQPGLSALNRWPRGWASWTETRPEVPP
jgi:hypothetical protein